MPKVNVGVRAWRRAHGRVATVGAVGALTIALAVGAHSSVQAASSIGISFETRPASFTGSTYSYAHQVPQQGIYRVLVVTVGVSSATAISSVKWSPGGANPDQTLTCDPTLNQVMSTTRRVAICTLVNPTVSTSGNVVVALASSDSIASTATTFTGVIGFGTPRSLGTNLTFGTAGGCVSRGDAGFGYVCTTNVPGNSATDFLVDLAGQGEPAAPDNRGFAAGSGQSARTDQQTTSTGAHLRVATSFKPVTTDAGTTMSWTYIDATAGNGVAHVVLTLQGATLTAATLRDKAGVQYGARGTRIAWETTEELSHVGFHVWRDLGGKRERITQDLLPGSAFMTGEFPLAGTRAYVAWDDRPSDPNARYWLEEIATTGAPRWHGPIAATPGVASVGETLFAREHVAVPRKPLRLLAVNAQTIRAAAPVGLRLKTAKSCVSSAANGASVKIGVSKVGWQRVPAKALFDAGLRTDADLDKLALFQGGDAIAMRVVRGASGTLDAVEFYGEAPDDRETDTSVYWLVEGNGAPARLAAPVASATGLAPVSSYLARSELHERTIYFAPLLNGAGENFFGAVVSDAPVTQNLALSALSAPASGQTAKLDVSLAGATASDHSVHVVLNGRDLGLVEWSGRTLGHATFEVPADLLREGNNAVVLTRSAQDDSVMIVDRISASYARKLVATDDVLDATAAPASSVTLDGFTSRDVRVLDVTDASHPVELAVTVAASTTAGKFTAVVTTGAGAGDRILRAFTTAHVNAPAFVTANTPSSLCAAKGGDVAVLAPRAFFGALAPWVAARTAAGFHVELVDIEDVFDEMTGGEHRADAIARFIATRTRREDAALKYVLLVGDASLDPRDFLGKRVVDIMPTALIDTPSFETSSDDALADTDGDGVPNVAMGRWPARTADEVTRMVQKTLAFDLSTPFARGSLIVAGTGQAEFKLGARETAESIGSLATVLDTSMVDRVAGKASLQEAWAKGPSFVQFFGHGSQGIWEGLIGGEDLPTLGPKDRPAVVASMTCLNGFFHDVYQESLAEQMLRAESGGVAVWSSSTLDDTNAHNELSSTFVARLKDHSLGEAVRLAKTENATHGLGQAMILLGDPTLFGVAPASAPPSTDPSGTTPQGSTPSTTDPSGEATGSGESAPTASPSSASSGGCATAPIASGTREERGALAALVAMVGLVFARKRKRSRA